MRKIVIAIDYDGTCVSHDFPAIGKEIGATEVLKELVSNGSKLILYTMRSDVVLPNSDDINLTMKSGNYLTKALKWFKDRGIPLYGVQINPTQHTWTSSPKPYATLFIDDAALGCPLKIDKTISPRPFVDWVKVREILVEMDLVEKR